MRNSDELRVLIAASGTGGHLFPAVFIARAFERNTSNVVIEFVGSGRPLEEKIIGGAGYKINVISMVGVKRRGILGLLQAILLTPKALLETIRLFRGFKPDVVIGVGGYVAFMPITWARLTGVKTWIHEAELKPGMANKVMSMYAHKVSVAFKEATLASRRNAVFTGQPVREELSKVPKTIPPNEKPRKILVVGGSQGANALDKTLPRLGALLRDNSAEILHQCRPENVDTVSTAYKASGINAQVVSFIDDMAGAYSNCHIVISRSGAGAVMELGVVNRPGILVPYPFAQGDHQTANALTLVNAGKALLVKEGDDFPAKLEAALRNLFGTDFYRVMQSRPFEGRIGDAADRIAIGCVNLIGI